MYRNIIFRLYDIKKGERMREREREKNYAVNFGQHRVENSGCLVFVFGRIEMV